MNSQKKLHDYQMCEHAIHHSSQWSAGNLCVDLEDPILRYTRVFQMERISFLLSFGLQQALGLIDTHVYSRRMDGPQPFDTNTSIRLPLSVTAR